MMNAAALGTRAHRTSEIHMAAFYAELREWRRYWVRWIIDREFRDAAYLAARNAAAVAVTDEIEAALAQRTLEDQP